VSYVTKSIYTSIFTQKWMKIRSLLNGSSIRIIRNVCKYVCLMASWNMIHNISINVYKKIHICMWKKYYWEIYDRVHLFIQKIMKHYFLFLSGLNLWNIWTKNEGFYASNHCQCHFIHMYIYIYIYIYIYKIIKNVRLVNIKLKV